MAMMTMVEFMKTDAPATEKGAAQLFLEQSKLMRFMPFETRAQPGVPFNKQAALPASAARAVGETYTPSTGQVDPGYEPMKIYGGTVQFDSFQVETGSGDRESLEIEGKLESAVRNFTADVFKGDTATDPRVVDGLQNRLTDTNKNLYAGGTAAFSMYKFMLAKKMCRNPTHVIVGEGLHARLSVASSNTSVGGYITKTVDAFGEEILRIGGLPLIVLDRDEADNEILDFSEASSTTSCYIVSFGARMFHGIQVHPPRFQPLGLDPTNGVQFNTVVDWPASIILRHDRAAVRYSAITDAAVILQ
jgi:hypothetical protein